MKTSLSSISSRLSAKCACCCGESASQPKAAGFGGGGCVAACVTERRELSLPFVCQCDLCMKQNVYSLHLATIKRQIQLFGVESVRRVA